MLCWKEQAGSSGFSQKLMELLVRLTCLPIFLRTLKVLLPLATPVPNLLVTNKSAPLPRRELSLTARGEAGC